MQYSLTISIPKTFEGTLDDWEQVFYAFEDKTNVGECIASIMSFCRDMEMPVDLRWKQIR